MVRKLFDYFHIMRTYVNDSRISRMQGTCFVTAVSDEQNEIDIPYFPRWLSRDKKNTILIKI